MWKKPKYSCVQAKGVIWLYKKMKAQIARKHHFWNVQVKGNKNMPKHALSRVSLRYIKFKNYTSKSAG